VQHGPQAAAPQELTPFAMKHVESSTPSATPDKSAFKREMGRISRNSGIVFAGTLFTAAFGYVFKVYLARVLGAESLGIYALGMTLVGFLSIVNALGFPDSAVRFVAVYMVSERFAALRSLLWNGAWTLLASNLVFAAILLQIGPWVATRYYHTPQLAHYLPLFTLIMVTGTLTAFFGNVLAGYKEVGRRTVIARFVASLVTMVFTILLISRGTALSGYLMAQIISALVVLILLLAQVRRFTPVEARSLDVTKPWIEPEVWSFSAAMVGASLMVFIMGQTDRIALGYYRSARDVGIYTVAAALVAYEPIVLNSVNQIFAPVIADLHTRGDHVLLGRLFQTLTKWTLGLTFPLGMVMILFARPIMRLFGHDFESGWLILVVGTCGQLVNCGVGSVGCLLFMSGNQHRLIRVQAAMAVVMVTLSILLIPRWGAWGAAVAAAVTNSGVNAWNLLEVKSALKLSPYNRSYLKLLPPILIALLIILVMSRAPIFMKGWLMILAALGLGYGTFAAAILVIGLDADDRLVANAVWMRLRGAFG
jgi:O-antigen/teichoic acid export membrane protein